MRYDTRSTAASLGKEPEGGCAYRLQSCFGKDITHKMKYVLVMSLLEIGCCGAYCGTCRVLKEQICKGCKIGYDTGERDIGKARCRIKVCCMKRGYTSCADCPDLSGCRTLTEFYGKHGYKYGKYRQAIEFIRQNGYKEFLAQADNWKGPRGKLKAK